MNFRKIRFQVLPKEHPNFVFKLLDDILSKSEGRPVLLEETHAPIGFVENLSIEEDGIWGELTIWSSNKNYIWSNCEVCATVSDKVNTEQNLLYIESVSAVWVTEEEEEEKNEIRLFRSVQ